MAFDLLSGKTTSRDWSCGAADDVPPSDEKKMTTTSKVLTGAVLGLGGLWFLSESGKPHHGTLEVTRVAHGRG
jgi:hypothetical protein